MISEPLQEGKPHRGPKWHGTGSADSYVFDRMLRPDSRQSSDDEEDSGDTHDDESFFMPLGESVKFPPLTSSMGNNSNKRAHPRRRRRGGSAGAIPWFNGTTPDARANDSHFAFDASAQGKQKQRRDRALHGRYISPQEAQAQRQEDLRLSREASGGVTLSSLGILSDASCTRNMGIPPYNSGTNLQRGNSVSKQAKSFRRDSAANGTAYFMRSLPALPSLPESLSVSTSQGNSIQVRAHYMGATQKFKLPAPSLAQLQTLVVHCFGLGSTGLADDSVSDEFTNAKTIRAGTGASSRRSGSELSDMGDYNDFGASPARSIPDNGWFSSRFDLKLSDMAFKLEDDTSLALAVQWARESVTGVLSISLQPKRNASRLPVLTPYRQAAHRAISNPQKRLKEEVNPPVLLVSSRSDSSEET